MARTHVCCTWAGSCDNKGQYENLQNEPLPDATMCVCVQNELQVRTYVGAEQVRFSVYYCMQNIFALSGAAIPVLNSSLHSKEGTWAAVRIYGVGLEGLQCLNLPHPLE